MPYAPRTPFAFNTYSVSSIVSQKGTWLEFIITPILFPQFGWDMRNTPFYYIDFAGFIYLSSVSTAANTRMLIFQIPYWLPTIPLTIVSLWLLLTNPANRPGTKSTNPLEPRG